MEFEDQLLEQVIGGFDPVNVGWIERGMANLLGRLPAESIVTMTPKALLASFMAVSVDRSIVSIKHFG